MLDILLLVKGMGGGMLIGVFVVVKEVMYSLVSDFILGYIIIFGGYFVSMVVGLVML